MMSWWWVKNEKNGCYEDTFVIIFRFTLRYQDTSGNRPLSNLVWKLTPEQPGSSCSFLFSIQILFLYFNEFIFLLSTICDMFFVLKSEFYFLFL